MAIPAIAMKALAAQLAKQGVDQTVGKLALQLIGGDVEGAAVTLIQRLIADNPDVAARIVKTAQQASGLVADAEKAAKKAGGIKGKVQRKAVKEVAKKVRPVTRLADAVKQGSRTAAGMAEKTVEKAGKEAARRFTGREVLDMSWPDIKKLNMRERRKALNALLDMNRKRIRAIRKAGIDSLAADWQQEEGIKFSSEGLTDDQLLGAISEQLEFSRKGTSTVRGSRAYINAITQTLNEQGVHTTPQRAYRLMKIYDKLAADDPFIQQKSVKYRVMDIIDAELESDAMRSDEEIMALMRSRIETIYQQQKRDWQKRRKGRKRAFHSKG